MKILLYFLVLMVTASIHVSAQETPLLEAYGGASILSSRGRGDVAAVERLQTVGWHASITGNLRPWLSAVADLAGQSKGLQDIGFRDSSGRRYQFLFGPELALRSDRTKLFGHALLGTTQGNYIRDSGGYGFGNTKTDGLLMGFGGGLDLNVSRHIAARVIQFDWLPSRIGEVWSKNDLRFGYGVVIRGWR